MSVRQVSGSNSRISMYSFATMRWSSRGGSGPRLDDISAGASSEPIVLTTVLTGLGPPADVIVGSTWAPWTLGRRGGHNDLKKLGQAGGPPRAPSRLDRARALAKSSCPPGAISTYI